MNYEIESKLAGEFFQDCLKTLTNKAHDYAQKEDCFSNFKTIAQVCHIKTEKTFLQFLVVKIARLVELIDQGKDAKNESIEDTLKDLANYSCLLALYLRSEKP